MDAREHLRARNRFTEEFPSGITYTYRLPRIRDCILAGRVPLPILSHLVEAASNGGPPEISAEDSAAMARFQDEIVRQAIVAIEGEPIEMTLDDVRDVPQADYDRLVEICTVERNPTPAGAP